MEKKFERLVLGYIITIIIMIIVTMFWKIIPNNTVASIMFITATLYYPAKFIGDNLHKVIKWLKKDE